ncbi:hypothetical protein TrRE_jg13331, partial [Triparma retinervis]
RLKVPKKETRNVELRGEARLLQELTAGVSSVFPNILPLRTFIEETTRVLSSLGFTRSNSLCAVGLSRDSLAGPLLSSLSSAWGPPYVTHSLGAQCNVGSTGLHTMLLHAPLKDSRSRTKIVVFTGPNLACNQDGEAGWMYRANRPEPVPTCGELGAFVEGLKGGRYKLAGAADPTGLDTGGVRVEELD